MRLLSVPASRTKCVLQDKMKHKCKWFSCWEFNRKTTKVSSTKLTVYLMDYLNASTWVTTNFIKRSDYILLSMLPFWKCVILTDVPFEPKVLFSSTCVSVGSSKSKVTLYDIVLLPVITSVTPTRPRFLMLVRLLSACWRFFAVMLFTNTGAIFSPP